MEPITVRVGDRSETLTLSPDFIRGLFLESHLNLAPEDTIQLTPIEGTQFSRTEFFETFNVDDRENIPRWNPSLDLWVNYVENLHLRDEEVPISDWEKELIINSRYSIMLVVPPDRYPDDPNDDDKGKYIILSFNNIETLQGILTIFHWLNINPHNYILYIVEYGQLRTF